MADLSVLTVTRVGRSVCLAVVRFVCFTVMRVGRSVCFTVTRVGRSV